MEEPITFLLRLLFLVILLVMFLKKYWINIPMENELKNFFVILKNDFHWLMLVSISLRCFLP